MAFGSYCYFVCCAGNQFKVNPISNTTVVITISSSIILLLCLRNHPNFLFSYQISQD